ncbi:hypothetical protein J2800_001039 [Caulobacter rhizosphaerae]|uniref:Uncharacterized protein n=1 Tax=Caulobacter rhizosphaerae TaxID=2010972 RepID=A0ABU1MVU0_9CAUL|nr:hypothetical protein [Caulobacter rhizosphaerae]MDR6530303.1 hypothetical protein [Caulobacter rhizosphaerae]
MPEHPHLMDMPKPSTARAGSYSRDVAPSAQIPDAPLAGEVLDLEGVAERRERFLAHAAATKPCAAYYFLFPPGATVAAFGDPAQQRSAQAQLEVALALTGGGLAKAKGAVLARVPLVCAARFETLAKPLIEAFLVAFNRADAAPLRT